MLWDGLKKMVHFIVVDSKMLNKVHQLVSMLLCAPDLNNHGGKYLEDCAISKGVNTEKAILGYGTTCNRYGGSRTFMEIQVKKW